MTIAPAQDSGRRTEPGLQAASGAIFSAPDPAPGETAGPASRDRAAEPDTAAVDTARALTRPDGVVLGYRLWRPGPPRRVLVLVHGLASNLTRWSELVARTRLREGWDLLRPDLRGFGTSLDRSRLGLDVWAADLAALLAHEACPPAVVAGHCLGAAVAVEFARRHPTGAAALILIDPLVREALRGPLRWLTTLEPLAVPLVRCLRGLNRLGLHRRRLAPLDLQRLDQEVRAAMAGDRAALVRRYASPWEDLRTTATVSYLQGLLVTARGLPDLAGVRVPVLALLASGGAIADPAVTARVLARHPTCRIQRVEATHWIPTEAPEALREAIEAFCHEIDPGAPRS